MNQASRIDAAELDSVRLSPDGKHLILLLRDATGQKVSLSLPQSCAGAILTAAPRPAEASAPHAVDVWTMSLAENGQDVIMTFCTREGMVMSFAIKPWQVQAMATVAAHGTPRDSTSRSVH
jgi:hypothetical protein